MYRFSNRLLKKVTYRKNVILLEFSEYMHIREKDHSYLNKDNYLLHIGKRKFIIPEYVKLEIVKKGFIIKMIFPEEYDNKLFNVNSVYLGYICKNEILYIQSFNGMIQNILTPICLEKEIDVLNIEEGTAEILDDNTLKYIYKGKNRFLEIGLNDFCLKKLNKEYYPKYLHRKENELIFSFEENVFDKFSNDINLSITQEPKSTDIYGLAIKENVNMKIIDRRPTYVESLSFSDYKEDIAHFKIYFSASLKRFFDKDFLIQRDDVLYRCFYEDSNAEKNLINVKVYNIKVENILDEKFKLVLLKNIENKIKTIDYNDKEIILKKEIISNAFISESIQWQNNNYKLSGSTIKISFQKAINPNSVITNVDFDEKINPWNGENTQIPSMALTIENEKDLSTLRFKNNKSFGGILINYNKDLNFTNKIIYNQSPCELSLNENELTIKFNDNEKSEINFASLNKITYNPGKNIKDLDENFIFCGYCPKNDEVSSNAIYIEPLKDKDDNPFNGGIEDNNFIIKVKNENVFRIYGTYEETTTITGFLKIVGKLNSNESIIIRNMKILGDIHLNIGQSNIVFDKTECNNLICEESTKV